MRYKPLGVLTLLMAGSLAGAERQRGVLVDTVSGNYAAERAGLQPGDLLLDWRRGAASGNIESPFALIYLEAEQGPRGTVTVGGTRRGQERQWTLERDEWGLQVSRLLPKAVLSLYDDQGEGSGRCLSATK